jgi:hypothetical protein
VEYVIILGFSIAFIVSATRSLIGEIPFANELLLRKPFNCDLCMSWWIGIPCWFLCEGTDVFSGLAAVVVSMGTIKLLRGKQ